MAGYNIEVNEKVLQQDMYYKNQVIMKYTIKYPQFKSLYLQTALDKINAFYRTRAKMYEKTNIMNLYQMAMVEYEYSVANNFPVRQFEAFTDYNVTYNQSCAISLYFDQYEYAGGAHGLTTRSSDSWNVLKSKKIELTDIFPHRSDVRDYMISNILEQIEQEIQTGDSPYFEDYKRLVNENFKLNNFYLTKEGVVLYFQQYDIAPYASGIPEFVIPYTIGEATPPRYC